MDPLILIRPTNEYAAEIAKYRREFIEAGDSMDGTGALKRTDDPYEFIRQSIEREDPKNVPADRVPATQLILVRKSDGRLVGMLQIRHSFTPYLERFGGHVGYSVLPSERRKGYAKRMLAMALPLCRELGLERVLITCLEGNEGSERTILANGGVYESTAHDPSTGETLKRFWTTL